MTTPNFPTDNLYKFITVSGAFIFLSALIFPFQNRHDLILKQAENGRLSGVVNDHSVSNEAALDVLESLQYEMYCLSILGLGLGLVLMFFGLIAWYGKVQRYEDKLLVHKQADG